MPKRRRKLARYKSLLDQATAQSLSPIDPLSDVPIHNRYSRLKNSTVLNSLWTANEKDRFFTALARCGKGDLLEVARRVGTKSLVEVTAYVGLLDEETEHAKDKKARHRYRVYDLANVPAAVEVDDEWLEVEEKCASRIAVEDDMSHVDEEEEEVDVAEEDESIFDVEQATEMATWYASMFYQKGYPCKLSADTTRNLDDLARSITKQLIQTILTLVTPTHITQGINPSRNVSVSDVRTAIDLLPLPRHYKAYWAGLPARMRVWGVRVVGLDKSHYRAYRDNIGEEGTNEEVIDYILSRKTSLVSRERTHTIRPWPAKWSLQEGFDWAKDPIQETAEIKQELDLEVSSHSTQDDSESMDETSLESDLSQQSYSSTEDDEEYDQLRQATNADFELLDSETEYLETLDTEYSQIEYERLQLYLSKGRKASRRFHQSAVRSFAPAGETMQKKTEWEKARKKLRLKFGNQWAYYQDEIVGVEGEGWERPLREWELWRKRGDGINEDNIEGMEGDGQVRGAGRKRKIEEVEDDESEFSG